MELRFIQARSLPALQNLLRALCARLVLVPQFHPPIYDGSNWIITWYTPIDRDSLKAEIMDGQET